MINFLEAILNIYNNITNSLPPGFQVLPQLFLFAVLIALYSIFIWIFYRFLARRDIIKIDLSKYNKFSHPLLAKTFAVIFHIVKFVIFLPFTVIFWFVVFSVLLVILAKHHDLSTVLLIAASVVIAIRISAYYNEDLSKDLAKMIPFTLLGVAILTPGFFEVQTTIAKLSQVPAIFGNLFYYALAIMVVEIVLRLFYIIFSFITSGMIEPEEE